ncbi:CzcE family metal-binding protein [Cupriavidus sp. Agwp_2]|uniref:CzcE family metal-binding protein n=1 Tax=Cupriavidus sp. Agwp_2 TaxID=2897324 RepID=UPI0035E433BD
MLFCLPWGSPSPVSRHAALCGSPAQQSYATRTVAVVPGMRYVNVDSGDTSATTPWPRPSWTA